MIVVVGNPAWRPAEPAGPTGLACGIATAAAARGCVVELVGRAGDDAHGDALMIALARAGVGHVAVLRDHASPTLVSLPEAAADDPGPLDDDVPAATWAGSPGVAVGPPLEPADVALGLDYLTAFTVLVVADDVPPAVLPTCVAAASFADAHLVVLVAEGSPEPAALPDTATVLGAPDADDGAFAGFVGEYAAGLDHGRSAADAFSLAAGQVWTTPTG